MFGNEQPIEELPFDDCDKSRLTERPRKKIRHPWWKKFIFITVPLSVVLFLAVAFYNAWCAHTWSDSQINYVKLLNKAIRPENAEQNALDVYATAMERYVDPSEETRDVMDQGKYGELNDAGKLLLDYWLETNQETWDLIVSASQFDFLWWEYPEDSLKSPQSMLMPLLGYSREFTKLGCFRARKAAQENRLEEALEDCLTIIRMSKQIQDAKLSLEVVMGIGVGRLAQELLLEIISQYNLDGEILQNLQRELNRIYRNGYPFVDDQAEIFYFLACLQKDIQKEIKEKGIILFLPVPGNILKIESRKEVEESVKRFYLEKKIDEGFGGTMEILASSHDRAVEMWWRGKTMHEAMFTILALKRWELDKGEYPAKLEELVEADYLEQLPDDPYREGILLYARRGADFVLYSVGADSNDDGGRESQGDEWAELTGGGDRLFWPVQDKKPSR
jgi:hypothetical protein